MAFRRRRLSAPFRPFDGNSAKNPQAPFYDLVGYTRNIPFYLQCFQKGLLTGNFTFFPGFILPFFQVSFYLLSESALSDYPLRPNFGAVAGGGGIPGGHRLNAKRKGGRRPPGKSMRERSARAKRAAERRVPGAGCRPRPRTTPKARSDPRASQRRASGSRPPASKSRPTPAASSPWPRALPSPRCSSPRCGGPGRRRRLP